jgi:chemotaxis protein CheC
MKLDVESLGTIYEMADQGAELAASRLTPMTGLGTRVAVTRLEFTAPAAVRGRLDDGRRRRGVHTGFSGGLDGTALVLFDDDSAEDVLSSVLEGIEGADEVRRSALSEVGQIITSGFVDGWADVLDRTIDLEMPSFVAGSEPDAFLSEADYDLMHDELALLFGSRVETDGASVEFEHLLFPDHESLMALFARQNSGGGRAIEYEKLTGFDRMVRHGATRVTDHLTKMTGIDASIDVRRVNFVSLDAIPRGLPTEPHVSVAFSFDGLPSGYLLVLFDQSSAESLVDAATEEGEGELDEFGRDTVGEISNIMASALLDGWANMLDTTIDHSTPAYAHDMGAAVVDPLIVGLSDDQEFAFVFDTRITALDATFDCEIYAIPDEADLERALDRLDLSRVGGTAAEAEFTSATADVDRAPDDLEPAGAIPEVEE